METYLNEEELIFILSVVKSGAQNSYTQTLLINALKPLEIIKSMSKFKQEYGINIYCSPHDDDTMKAFKDLYDSLPTMNKSAIRYEDSYIKHIVEVLNTGTDEERAILINQNPEQNKFESMHKYISFQVQLEKNCADKIHAFLDKYLTNYENDDLYIPQENIFKASKHFKAFTWLIDDLINKFGTKNIFVSQDLHGYHDSSEYRLLEFFLLMEKKGFIKIKEVFQNPKKQILKWDLVIDILRDPEEAHAIYFDWVSFGDLHFRPESGHAKHGKYSHHFNKTTFAYKLLNQFMIAKNGRFHVKTLCVDILNEPDNLELKSYRQKIHDAVHKIIRPKLGLDQPDSRIDILANEDHYILTAKP